MKKEIEELVIRKVESLINELEDHRERTKRADVALHDSMVEFVKTQFDRRVDEYINGSASIGDAIVSVASAGILFMHRRSSNPSLSTLAAGTRRGLHEDEIMENDVKELAKARRPEIDLLSTPKLVDLLKRLNQEEIHQVLNIGWA